MFPNNKIRQLLGLIFVISFVYSPYGYSTDADQPQLSELEEHIHIAEQGNLEAQYALALRYLDGKGVKANTKEALFWLNKGIEQNYPKAVYRYAKLFEEGRAVPKNAKTAAEWYLKAAQLGIIGAQRKMGELYRSGTGVNKDMVAAYAWYNVTAAASNAPQDKIHREYIGFGLSSTDLEKAQALSAELLKPTH